MSLEGCYPREEDRPTYGNPSPAMSPQDQTFGKLGGYPLVPFSCNVEPDPDSRGWRPSRDLDTRLGSP
jgi:hypothetical protein